MKILKFGGTSIGNAERIRDVLAIARASAEEEDVAVVVSAFGGVTATLIELCSLAEQGDGAYPTRLDELQQLHRTIAQQLVSSDVDLDEAIGAKFDELKNILHGISLVKECSPRLLDLTMSFGERLSALIVTRALNAAGTVAEFVDAAELVKTDDQFGNAIVNCDLTYRNIRDYFKQSTAVAVITGFIGSNARNEVTTLGRSGSDFSAAIFGAALGCTEIQIWTDVDGVMTADPKVVRKASPIGELTYDEAMEMSHFGSKVIHPKAMQPALDADIPIVIKNTFNPVFKGTRIGRHANSQKTLIRGISSIENIAILRVQGSGMIGVAGISGRLFSALAQAKISVILITQCSSEHSICFAVEPRFATRAKEIIEKEFELEILARQIEEVIQENDEALIAIVGEKMRGTPGIAARIFDALGKRAINVVAIAQGSSELNVSVAVNKRDVAVAVNAIHEAFFEMESRPLHVFLVGPGLVGSQLIEQISAHAERLQMRHGVSLKLNAIANSRKMIFDPDGLAFKDWRSLLQDSGVSMDAKRFLREVIESEGTDKVLVDCTASRSWADLYEQILRSGISVVTSNKLAVSASYDNYRSLINIQRERKVNFCYETTVGAGLPIISTIRDLIASGDQVTQIEAVVSGTLSFLFNSFDASRRFSEVVREAQQRGYTEPDPREDLSGQDVARKLLIMVREAGVKLEPEDVKPKGFLPAACEHASSVEDFFKQLALADDSFEAMRQKARKSGAVLRHIASWDGEKAVVSLRAVDHTHPFYLLRGNENIVSITTRRYREQPLVVRGPGAGAEVTAAGVLADIIRILN